MSKILINNEYQVEGQLSLCNKKIYPDEEGQKPYIAVSGVLSMHPYFPIITEIRTIRYTVKDIDVIEEHFGSNDHNITYVFTAGSIDVTDDKNFLPGELLIEYEKDLYKDDLENKYQEIEDKLGGE